MQNIISKPLFGDWMDTFHLITVVQRETPQPPSYL